MLKPIASLDFRCWPLVLWLCLSVLVPNAFAETPQFIAHQAKPNHELLFSSNTDTPIIVSENDYPIVHRVAKWLQQDAQKVTGKAPSLLKQVQAGAGNNAKIAIIVGTVGHSTLIDQLIANGKVDAGAIQGQWDAYQISLVSEPAAGIERAVIIAGSNKRGVSYGLLEIAEQMGISPWHYWADVPAKQHSHIYIPNNLNITDAPKVKYRGIFLNDEAPALSSWVAENFGNYNHAFYEHVFELLLRLKANFLWPAMWNNAFADDDPQNMFLADEYGIVMSTSHHEPMMRADKEWNRYGKGPWEYSTNPKELYKFWQDGAKRNKPYESIYTLGMRGQEDKPMSEGENIELLETIVDDQRKIFAEVFGQDAVTEVPQVWCLYKEVQAYYEKGMRVPDDVILLWSDDNWGNIRRLPTAKERERSGGAGVYYHFDYVGGPRSYRWINTVPISKIWEQMNLAYHYGANQIWITNVGDLKPMEVPISFFLDMAWDPAKYTASNYSEFLPAWAARTFTPELANDIAELISAYTRHNGRRKPEQMAPDTYSPVFYGEADRIEAQMKVLIKQAEDVAKRVPAPLQDAYFQLVEFPVKATAAVTLMNIATGKNRLYAEQGRANANEFAKEAKRYFELDAKLEQQYHSINGGKWRHFMNQPHIGYTNWNNPEDDQMPVTYQYTPGDYAEMGVAVEGVKTGWPAAVSTHWPHTGGYNLAFDYFGKPSREITLYNRGQKPYSFKILEKPEWLELSAMAGEVAIEQKLTAKVDWQKLPEGEHSGIIKIKGTGWPKATINISAVKPSDALNEQATGFIEADGYIAIDAANFTNSQPSRAKNSAEISWQVIPDFGRTGSAISLYPITDNRFKNTKRAPFVEYPVTFTSTGKVNVTLVLAPTWPLHPGAGLHYGLSLGSQKPVISDALSGFNGTDETWEHWVSDGANLSTSELTVKKAGPTTLRLYGLDPALTVQKIIIDTGDLKPSYLGPEQSLKR